MTSVVCPELGPLTNLRLETRPLADPGADEVRLSVGAAGVNFVDALFVKGEYQIKPPVPFVPGSDVAGVVDAVGSAVDGWAPGDRALAMVGLGGYASAVNVAASRLVRLPDGLDIERAAAMVQAYATARYSLVNRAGVAPGDKVLVLGAGGGVGLACVDTARALGADVVAAASSPERLAAAAAAGATHTVDYSAAELKSAVRDAVGFVDVVVDPVGGALTEAALRTLGDDGRLLVIGFASGEIPRLPANQILLRNRRVVGVDWGAWMLTHAEENQALLEEVVAAAADGRLHPVAPTAYPLADAAAALADLAERRLVGKAVLVP
ncbi:MAG: zinc-binding dehydrogenase [Acidimicrobiia bacterium]|nr:zinc-binding dehydrogenase [Acidimicrobiia bacterium]